MIFSKKASVQWKVDDWLDLNSKQEGIRLVGFKYQKGYDLLDLNSKQEGVRLVGFKYQKGYDWWGSNFRRATIGWIHNSIVLTYNLEEFRGKRGTYG